MSTRTRDARPAFTLMELTVSLAVCAMLMAALGSAVAIAAAALPAPNSPQTRVLETSRALERVSADLESSLYILSADAASPAYAIPDRDLDGAPDTQILSWAGERADPVLLVENGATPETVLDSAADFSAAFRTTSVTESIGMRMKKSGKTSLAEYPTAPTSEAFQGLREEVLWCQYIAPTLPAGAVCWMVDDIDISGMQWGDKNGEVLAQLRYMNEGEPPSNTVLEETTFGENKFGNLSASTVKINFSGDIEIDPRQAVGLLLTHSSGSDDAGGFVHEDGAGAGLWTADISTGLLGGLLGDVLSGDESPDWESAPGDWQLLYVLNGRYCTMESAGEVTHTFATTVSVSVTASGSADVSMDTVVSLANRPQLVDSVWEAEFGTDPTLHDINADGITDWAIVPSGSFDGARLSGGVWDCRQSLVTQPAKDMTGVVIGEIGWQCTSSSQPGATWTLTFDQSGGVQGNVTLHLAKANASEQSLAMTTTDGAGETKTLASMTALPLDMVETRVLIDPVGDVVSLMVNGEVVGAYGYLTAPYADAERVSTITPLGSGVLIDYARIREGGTP